MLAASADEVATSAQASVANAGDASEKGRMASVADGLFGPYFSRYFAS
jgi:hypothetical protein